MLDEKLINAVRKVFAKHDYIMTTAQLDSYRIYYADIQQLLNEGRKIRKAGKVFLEKSRAPFRALLKKSNGAIIIGQKLMANRKLKLSTVFFPMRCFVWKPPSFTTSTVTAVLPSGILRLIKMSPEAVQILTTPL